MMEVEDRVVEFVASGPPPDAAWFAARQPGVVRYLELRLGDGTELLGVGLHAASLVHAAYEASLGVAPRRLPSTELEQTEAELVRECDAPVEPSFVARQPALALFVAQVVSTPPLPLSEDEATRLGLSLATVVHAFDLV